MSGEVVKVRRAVFELEAAHPAAAFSARQQLLAALEPAILPALAEGLDGLALPGETLAIERLEIDLGVLPIGQADFATAAGLYARLGWAIGEQLAAQLRLVPRAIPPPVDAPTAEAEKPRLASPGETEAWLEASLVDFLTLGVLPWHAQVATLAELEAAVQALPPASPLANSLRGQFSHLLQSAAVRLRLVYQFSPEFVDWLPDWLYPAERPDIRRLAGELIAEFPPERALPPEVARLALLAALASAADRRGDLLASARRQAEALLGRLPPAAALAPDLPVTPAEKPASALPLDTIYVAYAGIVLLHPFLVRFFAALGLLDETERFRSPESQSLAVHLLYYLASGRQAPEEHQVPLLKLLCGYPLRTPLVKELAVSAAQRAEADGLLQAAIAHWGRLGAASPDSLREGFLDRQGRLSPLDSPHGAWRLVVEGRGIDILLEFLPWGLSTVHLPWLPGPLLVEWV